MALLQYRLFYKFRSPSDQQVSCPLGVSEIDSSMYSYSTWSKATEIIINELQNQKEWTKIIGIRNAKFRNIDIWFDVKL